MREWWINEWQRADGGRWRTFDDESLDMWVIVALGLRPLYRIHVRLKDRACCGNQRR